MKNINKYIMALAALAFTAVSCVEEVAYEKGEADLDGCYGVYIPTQANTTSTVILDPADPTTVSISAFRTKAEGRISVPVDLKESEEGIFAVSEIIFEDGQTETEFQVSFPNAEIGTTYTLSITVSDPIYASKYNNNPTSADISVLREKWNSLGTTATLTDNYFGWVGEEIEVLQNDLDPNKFRVIMGSYFNEIRDAFIEAGYGWVEGDAPTTQFDFQVLQVGDVLWKGEEYEAVVDREGLILFTDYISTSYVNTNYQSTLYYIHPYFFHDTVDALAYNKVISYQENGLPAGIQIAPFVYMFGVGGWDYSTETILELVFPGAALTDYSLELTAGVAEDGVVPVAFEFGADVAKAKYAVYEGELPNAKVESAVSAIVSGADKSEEVAESSVVGVTLGATGKYTLVAVTYDANGEAQMSASVTFGYVAADDEVPVVISLGMGNTEKYIPKGYNPETSLEYWIYGQDITSVKGGVFSAIEFLSDAEGVVAAVAASEPWNEEYLEDINGEGLVDLITNLTPGTEYYVVLVASNGYEEKVVTASCTTLGDPKKIWDTYTVNDYKWELAPNTSEGYFGTYNYYGVDYYTNETGLRSNMGQVTISDCTDYPDEEADENGYVTEYVLVDGIFGQSAKELDIEDASMIFMYYGGVLYDLANSFGPVTYQGSEYYTLTGAYAPGQGFFLGYNNLLVGAYVDEGYIAFCCNPSYESYGFAGFGLGLYADAEFNSYVGGWQAVIDVLLVDPAVDEETAVASAVSRSDLERLNLSLKKGPANYVETIDGAMRSAIDRMWAEKKAEIKPCGTFARIEGNRAPAAVEFSAEAASFSNPEMKAKVLGTDKRFSKAELR